jgi:rhodanese-related sulfurtransferase
VDVKLRQLAFTILSAFLITGSVLTSVGCAPRYAVSTPAIAVTDLTAAQASDLIDRNRGNPDFIVLDVRTPEEFAEGHIASAVNINFGSQDFKSRVGKLKRDRVYLVYCRSGNRSGQAIEIMKELHFGEIYHLANGISEWMAAGLPTVR